MQRIKLMMAIVMIPALVVLFHSDANAGNRRDKEKINQRIENIEYGIQCLERALKMNDKGEERSKFEKANFAASCFKDGKATKAQKIVEKAQFDALNGKTAEANHQFEKAIEYAQDTIDEYKAELKMLDR
ncbi:MAG TPA: hypothetical protein PKK43_07800 [Spirochaetota bacterium]|nr:hypothetical protein [Spirochaetota bacterium]